MEKQEILQEVNTIFRTVFQNSSITVHESTTSNDIEDWDSLNHAHLIAAVEKHFKIKFRLSEMMTFKDVGKMCSTIHQKLNS